MGLVGVMSLIFAKNLAFLIDEDVRKGKQMLFSQYKPNIMLHFDILTSRYQKDEQTQLQKIYQGEELSSWLQKYS